MEKDTCPGIGVPGGDTGSILASVWREGPGFPGSWLSAELPPRT